MPPPQRAPVAKKRGKKEETKEELPEEPATIIPPDQLKLSAKELDEEFPRVLTAGNPCHPHNLVSFNYATKAYVPVPAMPEDDVFFHVKQMAKTLHKDGEECKAQVAAQTSFKESVKAKRDARAQAALEEGKELTQAELEEDDTQRNQFNFTERATQTYNATIKSRVISTTPPDSAQATGSMTQWALHDAYVLEYERILAVMNMEKLAKEAKTAAKAAAAGGALKAKDSDNPMHTPEMAARLAIMERIVNQNAEDEIYSDFKYWDDAVDSIESGGRLLPLWRFEDGRTKRKMVTAVTWNQGFADLFAVGYGSYDFMRQGSGLIAVFSLKNVGAPEFTFTCESGVMSMDFHSTESPLLAVGLYDGSVRVYDVRKRENKPIYASDAHPGKHSDPVWEVKWARAAPGGPPLKDATFYSTASDGRLASWTVTKSELVCETLGSFSVMPAPVGDVRGGAIVAAAAAAATAAGAAGAAAGGEGGVGVGVGVGGAAASAFASGSSGVDMNGGGGDTSTASAGAAASGSAAAAVSALRGGGGGGGGGGVNGSDLTTPTSAASTTTTTTTTSEPPPPVVGLAGCCCFAFNPFNPNEYLVGTEEGRIHGGNLEAPGAITATYANGHGMAVYAIRWNPWHPRVFLTCSADWTVRVWDSSHPGGPIHFYDLNNAVADVAWAPYSSTVFAAACEDSKVAVWDLAVNKKEPLCLQKVAPGKKNKCTHIAFNAAAPVLIVGDTLGGVTSAKLSPNLRRVTPIPMPPVRKGEAPTPPPTRSEVEVRKLDAILAASNARVSIVTPIPGAGKGVGGEAGGVVEGGEGAPPPAEL